MKYLLIFSFILLIVNSSCYYTNEEDLYPELFNECDTLNITFSDIIKPVMADNCYECHSNENAPSFGNNLTLEDYPDVVDLQQVILAAIKHEPGVSPMPRNRAQLDNCTISQFEIWIENGSPR